MAIRRAAGSISPPASIRSPTRCQKFRLSASPACRPATPSAGCSPLRAARTQFRRTWRSSPFRAPRSPSACFPWSRPPGSVAIVAPTYGSHSDAWQSAGRSVETVAALDRIAPDTTIVIVGNPNNPDGRTFSPSRLANLARTLGARGGLLIVDEAFADVAPEVSLAPELAGLPAIVLRSFGKFYGLAGLRLGFAAGQSAVTARLAGLLGDWPVSASGAGDRNAGAGRRRLARVRSRQSQGAERHAPCAAGAPSLRRERRHRPLHADRGRRRCRPARRPGRARHLDPRVSRSASVAPHRPAGLRRGAAGARAHRVSLSAHGNISGAPCTSVTSARTPKVSARRASVSTSRGGPSATIRRHR